MRFLYNNISVLAVFSVCAVFAWLFGGTRGEYLIPVMPWVFALCVEIMLCFPQRRQGETSYEARERVWENMRKDPLVWVSIGLGALLLVPFLNVGLCEICDYPLIVAGADKEPTGPFVPFCVNRIEHLNVVMWMFPALAAVIACRHALVKRGKRLLIEMIVWNGAALGVLGMVQQMTGASGPLWIEPQEAFFFSAFGYPNMAGDYFTTVFGLAVGLWRWKLDDAGDTSVKVKPKGARGGDAVGSEPKNGDEENFSSNGKQTHRRRLFWKKNYFLIPAFLCFFCAVSTLSRASIILVTVLLAVFFLHTFVSFFFRMKKAQRVRAGLFSAAALALIAVCALSSMPENVRKEIDTLNTTEVLDRVTGKGQYHVRVATEIWKDNFLFGVGGWGYKHFCIPYMTEKELKELQTVGGINVHNDHLQFLAEHGIVGFGLMVAIVTLLIWPLGRIWKAMVDSVRFVPVRQQPPRPVQLFVIPPPVFCILMTATATVIHGFGDCPLRSPAVLTLFLVSLAAMDGFLPRLRNDN